MPTISAAPLNQGSPPSSQLQYQPQPSPSSAVVVSAPSSSSTVDFGLPSLTSTSSFISDIPATTSSPSATASTPGLTSSVIGSISRRNRRSFAALAREKTSSALANLSAIGSTANYPLRQSASSGSLQKHSRKASQLSAGEATLSPPLSDGSGSSEQPSSAQFEPISAVTEQPSSSADRRRQTIQLIPPISEQRPSSAVSFSAAKMHQTSSRLLRMTEDDRPFTKVRDKPCGRFASLIAQLLTLFFSLP